WMRRGMISEILLSKMGITPKTWIYLHYPGQPLRLWSCFRFRFLRFSLGNFHGNRMGKPHPHGSDECLGNWIQLPSLPFVRVCCCNGVHITRKYASRSTR